MTPPLEYLPGNVNVIHHSFEYIIEHIVTFVIIYIGYVRYMKKKTNIYALIAKLLSSSIVGEIKPI